MTLLMPLAVKEQFNYGVLVITVADIYQVLLSWPNRDELAKIFVAMFVRNFVTKECKSCDELQENGVLFKCWQYCRQW